MTTGIVSVNNISNMEGLLRLSCKILSCTEKETKSSRLYFVCKSDNFDKSISELFNTCCSSLRGIRQFFPIRLNYQA